MPIKYNNICKAKCQAPSGTVKVIRVIYDCLLLTFPGSFLRTPLFSGAWPGIPSCWPTLKWPLFQADIRYLHNSGYIWACRVEQDHGPTVQELFFFLSPQQ